MNTRTEHLIESFFANDLSEAETAELRHLLANDPEADAEFAWQQRLSGEVSKLSLANSIQNSTWKEAAKPPFRQVTMWRRALAAAAAVAVLVVAYFFLFPLGQSLESAAADNFEHYPNKMPFKSLGGPGDSSEQTPQAVLEAFHLYDTPGKSREAAEALGDIAAAYPAKLDYRFYQGVALLGDHQYRAAAEALRPVAAANNTYKTSALYYLGLAYAGMGDKEQARSALQAYVDSEDGVTYRKKAQNVLDAMKDGK